MEKTQTLSNFKTSTNRLSIILRKRENILSSLSLAAAQAERDAADKENWNVMQAEARLEPQSKLNEIEVRARASLNALVFQTHEKNLTASLRSSAINIAMLQFAFLFREKLCPPPPKRKRKR